MLLSLLNSIIGDTLVECPDCLKCLLDRFCSALNQMEEQVETKRVSPPG